MAIEVNSKLYKKYMQRQMDEIKSPCHKTKLFDPEKSINFLYQHNGQTYAGTGYAVKEHPRALVVETDTVPELGYRIVVSKRYVTQNGKPCFNVSKFKPNKYHLKYAFE